MGQSPSSTEIETDDFALELRSQQAWERYSHKPTDRVFAGTSVCKFVVQRGLTNGQSKSLGKAYFLNSTKWAYHYGFAQKVLGYDDSLSVFNQDMYTHFPRKYVLGTIVNYPDHDIFAVELWPGDNLGGAEIMETFELLQRRVFFEKKLKFRCCSIMHENNLVKAMEEHPAIEKFKKSRLISNDDLFGKISYQPLTYGISFGQLHILGPNDDIEQVRKDWIIVSESIPIDLPVVRGLITSELQTPLCHVALLCSNRLTPNMGLRDAHVQLKALHGKIVKMEVKQTEWFVIAATEVDQAAWEKKRARIEADRKKNITLQCNLDEIGIVDFSANPPVSEKKLSSAVGTKAYQLFQMSSMKLPNANNTILKQSFVIPFHDYNKHLLSVASAEHYNVVSSKSTEPGTLKKLLDQLRTAIESSPIADDNLLSEIVSRVTYWKEQGVFDKASGIILRSSTNVEDLPGFNGAGLYLSKSVKYPQCLEAESVSRCLRKVWASVWNYKGFVEREEFGLNQRDVAMGVVVMPYFKPYANGVAITENPFRADFTAFFLNTQLGSRRVTDNCDGAVAEQTLVYDDGLRIEEPTPEIVSKSSLTNGEPILTEKDINRMWPILRTLHEHFAPGTELPRGTGMKFKRAVDVEYLILDAETREICILQCRPYIVKYCK